MKRYPSIDSYGEIGRASYQGMTMFVWDKLDGSNIRAEWSRKKGFYKFGKRKGLVGEDHPFLGEAQQLFLDKYGDDLSKIFKGARYEKAVAFFEFFGPRSFAGWHHPEDKKEVVLFDISIHKKGIIAPREFQKMCGHLHVPNLVHVGPVNHEFADEVIHGRLPGMTYEGVVCKGYDKSRGLVMFKIKNKAWVDRVRLKYREDDRALKDAL